MHKKRILYSFLTVVLLLFIAPQMASAKAALTISTAGELQDLSRQVNSGTSFEGQEIELTEDIVINQNVVDTNCDLLPGSHAAWVPIGTQENPFKGSFNGNGHTVSGLYVNNEEASCQGLFGAVSGAEIYNITVKESYFNVSAHAGAVVGYAANGSIISNCHNEHSGINTKDRSGGIVGWTDKSDVYNCSSNGYSFSKRCSGGVVGDVYSNGKIYNCYNEGRVTGNELVGGITGGSTRADIQNCINIGEIIGGGYLLVGGGGSRTISNSFALQNDGFNKDVSLGTQGHAVTTFSSASAVLEEPVGVNGTEYTRVVDALNAWVSAQTDDIYYSRWKQTSMYPYLADGVISAVRTSYGSEVSAWSSPEMETAYEMDLIPETLIGEDLTQSISRAEFAAVSVKVFESLSGTKAIPIVNNPFHDTDDVEVMKAYGIGAINGTSAVTFSPDALLNREQAATMLTRVFKRITLAGWTLDTDSKFQLDYARPTAFSDDENISVWAKDSVYFMVANGIIQGTGNNVFAPKNITSHDEAIGYANATREQALAIAVRMVQKLKV